MKIFCIRNRGPIAVHDDDPVPDIQRYWASSEEDADRAKRAMRREGRTVLNVIEYEVKPGIDGLIHFLAQFECDLDNYR